MRARGSARLVLATTSVAAGMLGLGVARHAQAFCRTTTCDLALAPGLQGPPECARNIKVDQCSTEGKPLHWPGGCLWFGTEASGSEKLGISSAALRAAVEKAFATWAGVDCGGGQHPSFAVLDTDELFGAASCAVPEFNRDAANANVWMFSDSSWPNQDPANALAITLSTADLSTGELYDADVTLNSFGGGIAVKPDSAQASLFTVVLHEAGHYLGLAHSSSKSAVMSALYSPRVSTLDADDRDGICAIYPPAAQTACSEPEPRFGFSRYCGGVNPSTQPVATSMPTTPEASNTVKAAGCSVSDVVVSRSALAWFGPAFAFSIWSRRRSAARKSSRS
jgi:hypothetical protein